MVSTSESRQAEAFEGIYDAPAATKYLLASRQAEELYPVSSRTLIRWIRKGLAEPSLAMVPGQQLLITFEDLVSMRVIAAFRAYGVSWNKIYIAERWLREYTGHDRPFATEQLWTAQMEVIAKLRDLLVVASRHGQLAFEIIRDHLIPISGLTFENKVASTWEPSNLIVLNPLVQFGAPCIRGTSVPTRSIWGMIAAGDPKDMVRQAYRLTEEEIQAALDWEDALATAAAA